ncbi:nucleotidyltransferase family protein [uncultured Vibrio sp.]|uniref:nucleotidyltransferase family protein n=1 Tax=uncultured Vibrio sp. TaxID=114054 RepID=UPI0025EF5EEF|nr:nucleotidyltransferase family protein [uncultured Vibrio sp.]
MKRIVDLIKADSIREKALDCVYQLSLPQCYIAAGFVRNLVWDDLHHKHAPTPLADIDVIYFDTKESEPEMYLVYEQLLTKMMPNVQWQVRNQACMHERNGDQPYTSTLDAMTYWPEKETAVAIRKINADEYECIAAFGFESLFNLHITHNPKRDLDVFMSRVQSKNWLQHWPSLEVRS